MKKYASYFFALTLPMISYAGPYVGALAGYGVMDLTADLAFSIPPTVDVALDVDFSGKDFMAAPVAGYGWQWGRFRLGTEFQAFWTALTIDNVDTDVGNTTNITLEHDYVWLVRPGYQLFEKTPLVLYANLGAALAKITATPGINSIQAIDFDDNVWGYKAGLGFAYDITSHVLIRFDYIFSQYQTLSNSAPQDLGGGTFVVVDVNLPTTQSQYLFGLTYHW